MPELHIEVNNFTLGTSPPVHYVPSPTKCTVTPARDAVGKYMIVQTNNFTFYQLTMTELTRRLHGHITRIDHTGIVVPYDVVSKDLWKNAIDLISEHSNLYDYPTGANWPFIIPATTAEFANDISEFRIGREPKFELVRDDMGGVPLIQFAIETDLTKEQAITLFPDPVGCELGDLGDYFRSLYIVHPWIGLTLRFDLYYRDDSTSIYYESGEWFVKEGGRVR